MDYKKELASLRVEIDEVDKKMLELFRERMQISDRIGDVKASNNMALTDETRERQVIDTAIERVGEGFAETSAFMRNLIALSKIRQRTKLMPVDEINFPPSSELKPKEIKVAYQGVHGAWSEYGAAKMFSGAKLFAYDYFEDVFTAVKSGQTDYGVLPIENSQTGAIGEVYDLLRRHGCYIVGQTWVLINQCLLGCRGAKLSDIREVLSHPQGFGQCGRFLKNRNFELTNCRNTALAAQTVSDKNNHRLAAIGSRQAAEAYNLDIIVPDIMDSTDNRTRFIAISDKPIYNEISDTISVTFSTLNKSGALCAVLQNFMLADINLTRLESRPAPSDKYRFFVDLQANILDSEVKHALRSAAAQCEYFEILGCYTEGN